MALGETIGRAYVRILADGGGFGDDVRRQLAAHNATLTDLGNEGGAAYGDGFRETMDQRTGVTLDDLRDNLRRGAGRFNAEGEIIGDNIMDGLRDELEKRFGDVGTVMFRNLNEQLERGQIDFTGLQRTLQNLRGEVARATDDIVKDQVERFNDLEGAIKQFSDGVGDGARNRHQLTQDLQDLAARLPPAVTNTDKFRAKHEELRRTLARSTPRLTALRNEVDKVGDSIGRAFGKGSRNDFVNFFGGFMAILPNAIGALIGAGSAIKGFLGDIVSRFRAMREAGDGVGQALLSLASEGLPGLIAAAAGVAIAVKLMVSTLGILGSAVVLVTGLVLALAGSLAFALVGGLVAVAGALVPFAAAIGVAALAMGGLDKNSKAFKNLKKDWDDLKKSTATKLFGKDGSGLEGISGLMKGFKPLIDGVATALGGLLKQLGKFTQTKFFKDLMGDIGDLLPGMVTKLGGIFGKLAIFIGEAFVAAGPIINEFLGWLDGVATKMVDFGKGGKKSGLAKFFEDAWESAKIVGTLIAEIALAIGDLFGAGKGTGDSIFTTLTGKVKEFREWLQKAKDDGTLQQFFDDAELLAGSIGRIVGKVIELIDALDTPGNRTMLFTLLGIVEQLIGLLTTAAGWVDKLSPATAASKFTELKGAIEAIDWSGIGTKIREAFAAVPGQIAGFFSGLGTKIMTAAGSIATSFTTWISGIFAAIPGVISQITGFFSGLATKIWTAAGNAAATFGTWLAGLPGAAITAAGAIIVSWIDLAGRMITAAGDIIGRFTQWLADLPGRSVQAVVNITVAFINLGIKIIQAAGSLAGAFATWIAGVPAKIRAFAQSLPGFFSGLASKIIARAGSLASSFASWVASLPGKARSAATSIISAFSGLASRIIARAGSIASSFASWLASLPGKARAIVTSITSAFSGMASKAIAKAGSIVSAIGSWASGVSSAARGVADDIVNAFRGLASRIVAAIGTIIPKIEMPHITIPHITPIIDKPGAAGFVTAGPQMRLIGEAGPEAVVPLHRPLSQVDPAVRMLSAFAQGKLKFPNSGGSPGKTIDIGGITINTPTEDPRAVASEVVARMTATSYI